MDGQKRPRAREKRVVNTGKGVEKQGSGLGTGPVNNTGNYEKRREQEAARTPQQAPQQRQPGENARRTQDPRDAQNRNSQSPFAQSNRTQSTRPLNQQQASYPPQAGQRPAGTGGGVPQNRVQGNASQRPGQSSQRPMQTGGGIPQQRPTQSGQRQNPTGGGIPQRPGMTGSRPSGSGQRSGGSGKLLLIIAVLAMLFGGGRLSGLLGGNSSDVLQNIADTTGSETGTVSGETGSGYGQNAFTSSVSGGTGMEGISNLLNALMGSGSSVYDFTGTADSLAGSGNLSAGSLLNAWSQSASGSGADASAVNSGNEAADETVVSGAREKYTKILGGGEDRMTILVYLCGTDLESQNGMGTSDLKEMAKASLGEKVNLIVFTGGCRRWQNQVVSNQVNQIYQIRDGGLYCLEENAGSGAMTTPSTLTGFISYGAEHFPANRMALILWDHGGGSVSGYGYDEKNGRSSMTLSGINSALKSAGIKFDFIGFDACLMATVENGLMLGQYADYMIASEETEPGVGWYYTGWLNELGKNPGMPTVQIGKKIADDFVSVCSRQCRGQATTLSVVDLAELQATMPNTLKAFSEDANEKIQEKEYRTVANARAGAREFAQSTKIDQIDLKHFALNMNSAEGRALAEAVDGAVKYNRTGGGMTNAWGLSIYFPYKRAGKVSQMVNTYAEIGMEEEYTRCIQAFASMEVSGQVAAGTPVSSYGSAGSGYASNGFGTYGQENVFGGLMGSLTGGSGFYGTQDADWTELVSGLFGGSSSGLSGSGLADLFGMRLISAEDAIEYIGENRLDADALVWENGRIHLTDQQWSLVESVVKNVFFDDGKGFIDLGCDNDFILEGNDLVGEDDGTWLSINGQPVAYYYLGTEEVGDEYRITGYVPAYLNGIRVRLMLVFDNEHPYGTIAGAQKVYAAADTEAVGKNLIQIGAGDQVRFICDYFDYDGNYQDTYYLGNPMTLGDTVEIANTPIGDGNQVTYCITDIYQNPFWTPVL